MDEGLAVIVAALMAILGIFYTSRQQRRMLRKQHTYQVIEKLNDWKEFDENLDFASNLIRSGRGISLCDEDKADCDRIDFLLNYYEFLSSSIICGDIDEDLVRRVERDRLCRLYLKFFDYIDENRIDRDNPRMWENLEFMCYRWTIGSDDGLALMIERFRLRPVDAYFHARRNTIRDCLDAHRKTIK